MTVTSTSNKITYQGNGATTSFPFTFPGVSADDLDVIYTDADGNETTLASTAYTVTLNAAVPPNPTAAGGTVTYNPSGTPIASGTSLTIIRELAIDQPTSLANQGTSYQSVIEQALDYQAMVIQQLSELIGRSLIVAVSDEDPETLPTAAQRANKLLGFDADGNPIAAEFTDAGQVMVSSAMIPVVEAATLAAARTAFGLGGLATLGVGAGLASSGGNARVVFTPAADATNQAVTSAFHLTERHATGALTYTNPDASTLFAGFGYWVYALTGAVTFAIDASDSFSGMSSGTSLVIQPGTKAWISTDGTSTWFARIEQYVSLSTPLNFQLSASVAGNALTIAVKDPSGNDPSTTYPILVTFRSDTLSNGALVTRAITGALSIVVPSGGTLGTSNGTPSRIHVLLGDNGGTVIIGVINCLIGGSVPTAIFPLDEASRQTFTAITAGSGSAGTFYGNSGATTIAWRYVGYVDFFNGQAAAGTWATAPSIVEVFGPGVKMPGDLVQVTYSSRAVAASTTSSTMQQTSLTKTFAKKNTCNLIRYRIIGSLRNGGTAGALIQMFRDAAGINRTAGIGGVASMSAKVTLEGLDIGTTTSPVYEVYLASTDNASSVSFPYVSLSANDIGELFIEEIRT